MGFITRFPQIHSENVARPDPGIYFRIPDTLRNWPWSRHINPHYSVCKTETVAWFKEFKAFSPESQDAFDNCDFSLLGSLVYPSLNKAGCRVGCDLMTLYYMFDEYSDVANPIDTRQQADIIMDALHHPHRARQVGEWIGGEVTRQFWENAIKTGTPAFQRHFIDAFKVYTDGVVQEASDRAHNLIRDVETYLDVRRCSVGAEPAIILCGIHMDLPDSVLADPAIQKLTSTCIDMVVIANDLHSYNIEQALGEDGHNLVRVVMDEQGSTLEGALAWISHLHDDLIEVFLREYKRVPTQWGSPALNDQVAEYVQAIINWVRGHDCWNFESVRFFGKAGPEVMRTRVAKLLPLMLPSTTD
ncbi:terpenoid synthase [Infundibulicybe gibba]|nr:terpenoid synthase [Infundibulicybe gibba]